ncbi:hypothetical protein QJS04_geneDACA008131 [Acorus gramineus]|uniref:Uncharacterized protein n=1 Tax=Acorus gramineus TaxID=55184 RepID=A0AAV9AW21_ACOGR|nr:hypothetical protein QJS04_geneDACA008131 [Acorus gramineus]
MHCSRNAFSKNIVPGDSVDWSRIRRSSSHELETSCHQKFSNKDGDKVDDWKKKNSSNNYPPNRSVDKPDKTADELSLLDLLDDGPQRNISENLMPEDHVAFSVEGLGRIGMETPVHTPRQPSKTSSNAFSFLPKFPKKLKFISSDIDFGLNAMMGDIKTVWDGNSPGWNSMAEGSMQHNSCDSPVDNIFTVDKDFGYVSEQKREKNWTVGSDVTCDDLLDDKKYGPTTKHQQFYTDRVSADLPKVQNFETCDIEDQFFMNRRNAVDANRELDITELSGPLSRHTTFGNDNELGSGWRRCMRTTGNPNFENVISEPSWPYLETEDSVDSKSLLSEESCSSAAVRSNRSYVSGSNREEKRQSRKYHGEELKNSEDNYNMENLSSKDREPANLNKVHSEKIHKRGEPYMGTPKLPKTGQFFSEIEPECSLSFDEEYCPKLKTNHSPWNTTSNSMDEAFFNFKFGSEENIFSQPVSPKKYPEREKSYHGRSKADTPEDWMPPNCFRSKNMRGQPPGHTKSTTDPQIFLNVKYRPKIMAMHRSTKRAVQIACSSYNADFQFSRERDEDESESKNLPGRKTFKEKGNVVSNGEDGFPSGIEKLVDILDSKESCGTHEEAKDETFADRHEQPSPYRAEEMPSPEVKVHGKLESNVATKHDVTDEIPSQITKENLFPERQDFGLKGGCSDNGSPSYQVMLESCVLRLLCVQKVLMEGPGKGNS